MPTIVSSEGDPQAQIVNLSTTQTGNGDSTNTLDRRNMRGAALLKIVTTVGTTPTVTVNILGSVDGTNFFNAAYAVGGVTPETVSVAAIVITSAVTNFYILRAGHPWRFLKLVYSANTNVTLTADIFP